MTNPHFKSQELEGGFFLTPMGRPFVTRGYFREVGKKKKRDVEQARNISTTDFPSYNTLTKDV